MISVLIPGLDVPIAVSLMNDPRKGLARTAGTDPSLHCGISPRVMSAGGHKQTSRHPWVMSALLPKADMDASSRHVRFVPQKQTHAPQRATCVGIDQVVSVGRFRIIDGGQR
jgi:hypothetical protein